MTSEKKISNLSLCALWFGASISLAEIMTGSLIAPLGLSTGIAVILLGHLIGCLILSFTGIIGFKEKKPSLMASRFSLGKYGSYIISIFNIIQLTGWTAIMLIQCSRSLQSLTGKLFGFSNFTVIVVFTGILVALWALNNAQGISIVNNLAVMLLLILCIFVFKTVVSTGTIKPLSDTISFGMALELSIIMPLSWVPLISDYTQSAKSIKSSFLGSFAGYFVGSSLMYIMGLVFSLYSGSSDTIAILSSLNLGLTALLIVILSTVTTTFLDVYSAVMSTLNLNQHLSKNKLIILFTALGIILAIIFPMENYENFLYMIGSLFAPAFSVILIDYFLYKKDRSVTLLNIPAILAMIAGIATYYTAINMDLIIGSTIPCMLVTIIAYAIIRWISDSFYPIHDLNDKRPQIETR
jgi:putative hydroxymethylpyrimidine transporter CytX